MTTHRTIAQEVSLLASYIRGAATQAKEAGSRINAKQYAEDLVCERPQMFPKLSTCKTDWLALLKKELGF